MGFHVRAVGRIEPVEDQVLQRFGGMFAWG